MKKNSKPQSNSKTIRRTELFGPPPILEGENSKAYDEMLDRGSSAVGPADFIEEIWVHDVVDVIWSMLRWRRILSAHLTDQVWDQVNDKATSIAESQVAELTEGPEKSELDRLLDSDFELSWEALVAKYPRANEKFQELWSAAKLTLDTDLIQARVLRSNLDMIERIETLIASAQRRFDEIIREMDRHRFMQKQLNSSQNNEPGKSEALHPKLIAAKPTNKKVA